MSTRRTPVVTTNAALTPSPLAGEGWGGGALPPSKPHENLVSAARNLRRNLTPAERKLWRALRELNATSATHFRKQAPIGPYIADFCEHTRKLIIEVDGGQHNEPPGLARDAKRTAWLKSRGYRVIRFSNIEVLTMLEGVMTSIMIAADILPTDSSIIAWPPPTPALPRKGGGSHTALTLAQKRRLPRLARRSKANAAGRTSDNPAASASGSDVIANINPNVLSPFEHEGPGRVATAVIPTEAFAKPSSSSRNIDPIVPSPLAGEGQGGGYAANSDAANDATIRSNRGTMP